MPAGTSVGVQARAADSPAGLALQVYQPVSKNVNFAATGRYIQVLTRLNATAAGTTPVVFDLTVSSKATSCDVDADGDVDTADLALIRAAIGQTPTANDPRDANGDGKITINDVRACSLQCTRAGCAQ